MTGQSTQKDQLKAQWEARADDWISRIQDTETSHREAMLDGWTLDAVGDVAALKVIDLGCGEPTPTDAQAARYPFVSDNLRVPEFIIYILRKP